VPSSQALPGFLVTAPPSVCVPAVVGVLAVWIQHQKKIAKKNLFKTKTKPNVILRFPILPGNAFFQMNVDLHFAQNQYEPWLIASGERKLFTPLAASPSACRMPLPENWVS